MAEVMNKPCPCDMPECGAYGCYCEKEAQVKRELIKANRVELNQAKRERRITHYAASSGGAIPFYG